MALDEGVGGRGGGFGGGAEEAGLGLGELGIEEDVEDAVDREGRGEPSCEEGREGVGVGRAEGDGGLCGEFVVVEPPDVGADDRGEGGARGEDVADARGERVGGWAVEGFGEECGAGHDEEGASWVGDVEVMDKVGDGGVLRRGSVSRKR